MKSINITSLYHIWNILGKLPVMASSIKGLVLVFHTYKNDLMVIRGQIRIEGENIELDVKAYLGHRLNT